MKTATLISRMHKAGVPVTQSLANRNRFMAHGRVSVVWHDRQGDAVCVHTPSPHTDVMTDCFCDTWHNTVRAAVGAAAG